VEPHDPDAPFRHPFLIEHPASEQPPAGPVRPARSLLQRATGAVVAAALAVLKFGALLLKGKFLISFAITAAIYAWVFGWQFGIGLVLLLLVHELGHVIELRRQGVPSSAPMFVPFVGAFVSMRQMPGNAWQEAKVGLAGPILGSVGAFAVLAAGDHYHSNLLRALAYFGCFLNLINLVPVVPLDGGRAAAALHPIFWFVGLFMVAMLAFVFRSPFFFLVLVLVAYELYIRWSHRNSPASQAYHTVTWSQRISVGAVYLGLVAVLVVGMQAAYVPGIHV
jgi:Zn-dependent protease